MGYTQNSFKRISLEEAEQYIPLSEDYTGITVDKCPYYTSHTDADGWDNIQYFTGRKRNRYINRTNNSYDSWLYILSNQSMPGHLKIGYTKQQPDQRAKQLSTATGVPTPFKVEWAFHCFNAEGLEREIHQFLEQSRIMGNREFFDITIDEAKQVVYKFGQNYI